MAAAMMSPETATGMLEGRVADSTRSSRSWTVRCMTGVCTVTPDPRSPLPVEVQEPRITGVASPGSRRIESSPEAIGAPEGDDTCRDSLSTGSVIDTPSWPLEPMLLTRKWCLPSLPTGSTDTLSKPMASTSKPSSGIAGARAGVPRRVLRSRWRLQTGLRFPSVTGHRVASTIVRPCRPTPESRLSGPARCAGRSLPGACRSARRARAPGQGPGLGRVTRIPLVRRVGGM